MESKNPRTRTIGFRLTEFEYDSLVNMASDKQRRVAELVRLIVVQALKVYATKKAEQVQKAEAE